MTRPRQTELFLVMTMYNEDDSLFTRNMQGGMKNIAYLRRHGRSKTWGQDGRKKVFVHIVSDSRRKISSRTLSVFATKNTCQEGIVTNVVDGKPMTAHVYEYATQSTSHDARFLSCLTTSAVTASLSNARRKGLSRCKTSLPEGEEPEADQPPPLVLVL